MRLRTLVMALALAIGGSLTSAVYAAPAAARHARGPSPIKRAKAPKPAKRRGSALQPTAHRGKRAARHAAPPKPAKHKAFKAARR